MKYFIYPLILFAAFVGVFAFSGEDARAQINPFDIEFPVAELGNCGSLDECAEYCDDAANTSRCVEWARGRGFDVGGPAPVPDEGGPGGCRGENECRSYCDTPSNFDECIGFAEANGHISPGEAARARRGGPGGCRTPEQCNAFCNEPANSNTCIDFAVAEGQISSEEAARAKRGGPGGCRSAAECNSYCSTHQVECIDFAVAEGQMSSDEAEEAKKFLRGEFPGAPGRGTPRPGGGPPGPRIDVEKAQRVLEEAGGGPGGCQGFEECDQFCSNPANGKTCLAFAKEHDLFEDRADAEKFERLLDVEGPGGCRGQECRDYCETPGHEEECLAFAEQNGLMKPDEAAQARKFLAASQAGGPGGCRGRECEQYCGDPAHRDECFEFAKTNGLLPPKELARIEKFKSLDKKVQEQGGPGGCRGEGECRKYCSDPSHFEECTAFAVNEGFLNPNEAKKELQRFVEVERFEPRGRGPAGFGPPPGFGSPPGFGPGGVPGDVPPEFQERFDKFNQIRAQFERGEMPRRDEQFFGEFKEGESGPPQGFPPGEGREMRPPLPRAMPQEGMMPQDGSSVPPRGFPGFFNRPKEEGDRIPFQSPDGGMPREMREGERGDTEMKRPDEMERFIPQAMPMRPEGFSEGENGFPVMPPEGGFMPPPPREEGAVPQTMPFPTAEPLPPQNFIAPSEPPPPTDFSPLPPPPSEPAPAPQSLNPTVFFGAVFNVLNGLIVR
ncbi:MAG: hypothetical protein HYS74_00595 [Parcubacteria group bacterium]|nr:hypothetical protein [Parcubacteria group bacterium]